MLASACGLDVEGRSLKREGERMRPVSEAVEGFSLLVLFLFAVVVVEGGGGLWEKVCGKVGEREAYAWTSGKER